MMMSEQIGELMGALAKAQSEMKAAYKDSSNPYFKSKYANFASVVEAGKMALSKNGLSITQIPTQIDGRLCLVSILGHSSGQWIKSEFPLLMAKQDPQAMASATTYAKRLAWAALAGISTTDEDDDGEKAMEGFREAEKMSKDEAATAKMFWDNFSKGAFSDELNYFLEAKCEKGKYTKQAVMMSALNSPEKFLKGYQKWFEENQLTNVKE